MKRIDTEDTLVLEPAAPADSALILLHGLGADGDDLAPLAGELRLPPNRSTRFVLPHAPLRSMALAPSQQLRAWYDVFGFDRRSRQDEAGIRQSARRVENLIAGQCAAGIAARRIVLAGFSQGGAIALHVGLRYPERLAGLLAMSTYLPLEEFVGREASPANRDLPILMFHGEQDPTLPVELGILSRDGLREAGYAVDWQSYPTMGHSICAEEIDAISGWLNFVLRQETAVSTCARPSLR